MVEHYKNGRNYLNPILIFVVWFGPIFTSNLGERISSHFITFYFLSIIFFVFCSLVFFVLKRKILLGNKRYLLFLTLFFLIALLSDVSKIKITLVFFWYGVSVYLITILNRKLIWDQYFFVAKILSIITILDILIWMIIGETFFTVRISYGYAQILPRLAPLNNEMFQHSLFLSPAFFHAVKEKKYSSWLIGIAILLSQSSAGLLLIISLSLIIFARDLKKIITIMVFFLILIYFNGFVYSKLLDLQHLLEFSQVSNSSNLYHVMYGIEVIKKMNFMELLFGAGYYNIYEFSYSLTNTLGSPVALFSMVIGFGLPLSLLFLYLILSNGLKNADRFIFIVAVYCLFFSLLKQHWALDDFLNLFFLSGLAWSLTNNKFLVNSSRSRVAPNEKLLL